MALNKINADSIADGTVVASDIADGTITLAKLQSGLLPSATANSAATYANSAFLTANTPSYTANSAASYANSAFSKANTGGTFTSTQIFSGSSSVAAIRANNILEVTTVSATAATGTINYDVTTQSILYYTTNASGNFTINFRGSSGTSLNTIMSTGDTMTVTFLCTNGSTAYYNSAVTIDGNSVTPKWQGGTAPTSGNASSVDGYTYAIIKTASATFTVLASQTKFA